MLTYEWPRNIREMKNAIERAVVMGSAAEIQPEDLPAFSRKAECAGAPPGCSLKEATDRFKREFVAASLRQYGGSRSLAAKSMQIQRTYLSRLIAKYGLQHL